MRVWDVQQNNGIQLVNQLQRILSVTEPKFDRKLQQYAQNCSRQRHTLLGFGLELNAGKNLLLNLIESFLIKLCTQFG